MPIQDHTTPTLHKLVMIAKIQQIHHFFSRKGFTSTYILDHVLAYNFHISRGSYYRYLKVDVATPLRTHYGVDYKMVLSLFQPLDYQAYMNGTKQITTQMIIQGCKH